MKCRDFEELLSAYADGELPRTQREFIEKHLAGCADCRQTLADFEAAGRRLSSLKTTMPEPDIAGATLSRIKSPVTVSLKSWPRLVMAAASIIAVIILVLAGQTWASPEAIASSIVRHSPEVKAALDGEEITTVEVTTSVVDQHGDVLMLVVRTEDRALTAEVDLRDRTVINIVRVNIPDFQSGDEQRTLEIAEADPQVRGLLDQGGIVTKINLFKSINPDPTSENPIQDGTVTPSALVTIDVGGQDWNIVVDLEAGKVVSAGKTQPSSAMILVYAGRYARDMAAPALLVLGILLLLGLALNKGISRATAGIFSLVMGLLAVFIALYALSSIWWRLAFVIAVPAMALVVGMTALKQKTAGRGLSIAGTVLGALALALVLFNEIMLPGANTGPIVAISIIIAGIIIYAFKEKIMALNHSGRVLRPVLIGVAAVAVLILALAQPWNSPNTETVFARAYDAASSVSSYHMKISANTWNPDGTSEQSLDIKFSAPDRYHVTSLMSSAEFPVSSVEYIIIGEKQYVRKISGDFDIDVDLGTPAEEVFLSRETTLQYLGMMTDIKTLPDETVNNIDCFHYTGVSDTARSIARMQGIEVEQLPLSLRNMYRRVELWIGKDDYLIRKMRTDRLTTGDPQILGTVERALDYLSINEPVAIKPPVDADANPLEGWELAGHIEPGSGRQTFTRSMTVSIHAQDGYNDAIHQEVRYAINLTNQTDESVKNVRITIATALGDGTAVEVEAIPEANLMAPGQSLSFNATIPFDASGYTKEELTALKFGGAVTVHFETESGIQMTEPFENVPPPPPNGE